MSAKIAVEKSRIAARIARDEARIAWLATVD